MAKKSVRKNEIIFLRTGSAQLDLQFFEEMDATTRALLHSSLHPILMDFRNSNVDVKSNLNC